MSYDELELDKLGDEKSALFFLISDTDTTYNFLVALAFSQMFNLLCERADNTYGGRLPYHVRVLWDEAANTGQVPGLEKIVAVIRSREISLTLFYQAMSQCKALYKDHSETIMGNMDSIVFLGGREASTLKDISENWLGKATISMQTEGRSRGQSESYSQNMQRLGRELMTTSEITTMPGDKCILQLILADYLHLLRVWRKEYAPHSPEEVFHPRFVEALQKQDHVEYLLDVLLFGEIEEKAALITEYGKDVIQLEQRMAELAAADAARTKKHHERHAAAPEH